METLIGTDGMLARLSGSIAIAADPDGMQLIIESGAAVQEGPEGMLYADIKERPQRIVLSRLAILDVETKPKIHVQRNWGYQRCALKAHHEGGHEWRDESMGNSIAGECMATRRV